jgi:hypothetical protein
MILRTYTANEYLARRQPDWTPYERAGLIKYDGLIRCVHIPAHLAAVIAVLDA